MARVAVGGAGASVTQTVQAEVDFGHPSGGEEFLATATVAATWVAAGSVLSCLPLAVATADHDPEDVLTEGLDGYAFNVVPGVGFDVAAVAPNGTWGRYMLAAATATGSKGSTGSTGSTGAAGASGTAGAYATDDRPDASTVDPGISIYDTDLGEPLWSDGTIWRYATGESAVPAAPPNDMFADAWEVVIPTDGATYTSDVSDNTTFSTESGDAGQSFYKSAWWYYTPATSGSATFDLALTTAANASGTDTYMHLSSGSSLGGLTYLTADDDGAGGGKSKITGWSVTGGVTYRIRCSSFNATATMLFILEVTGPASA